MKRMWFLSLVIFSLFSGMSQAADKPFRRVYVVSSGSTYDTAVIVGVLNALEKEMTSDDLILATNASALAAAIFTHFPDPKSRLDYLASDKYYAFLKTFTIDAAVNKTALSQTTSAMSRNQKSFNPNLPTLVGSSGIQVLPEPFALPNLEGVKWSTAKDKPRLMILATKVNFDPSAKDAAEKNRFEWMRENKRALFTVVGYTDPETAKKLTAVAGEVDVSSHYGALPLSIDKQMEFVGTNSLSQAIRKTLGNAPLFGGVKEEGQLFIGGASDHDPVDLALSLSKDGAAITYSGSMGAESVFIKDIYNYDINQVRGQYASKVRLVKLEAYFHGEAYKKVDMSLDFGMFKGFSVKLPEHGIYADNVKVLYDQGEAAAKGVLP